jgi:hypothetical protein
MPLSASVQECPPNFARRALTDLVAKEPHDEDQRANRYVKPRDHAYDDGQPESATVFVSRPVHFASCSSFFGS